MRSSAFITFPNLRSYFCWGFGGSWLDLWHFSSLSRLQGICRPTFERTKRDELEVPTSRGCLCLAGSAVAALAIESAPSGFSTLLRWNPRREWRIASQAAFRHSIPLSPSPPTPLISSPSTSRPCCSSGSEKGVFCQELENQDHFSTPNPQVCCFYFWNLVQKEKSLLRKPGFPY